MTTPTLASDAIARIDDGHASPADRLIADLFDAHSQDRWTRVGALLDVLPADVCACGGRKEPAEFECQGCFLDHDDAMRRADDQ